MFMSERKNLVVDQECAGFELPVPHWSEGVPSLLHCVNRQHVKVVQHVIVGEKCVVRVEIEFVMHILTPQTPNMHSDFE